MKTRTMPMFAMSRSHVWLDSLKNSTSTPTITAIKTIINSATGSGLNIVKQYHTRG